MERPKPIDITLLASPSDYQPTRADFRVVGAFNPGATQIRNKDGKVETVLYVRVAEAPIDPPDMINLPYFHIPNNRQNALHLDYESKRYSDIREWDRKHVVLNDGSSRLRHISLPHMQRHNKDGDVIERSQDPVIQPSWESDRFGLEDVRITHFKDGDSRLEDTKRTPFVEDRYLVTYPVPHETFGVMSNILSLENILEGSHERVTSENTPRPEVSGKDVVLFPEKVPSPSSTPIIGKGDRIYAAFTRPNAFPELSTPGIWIAYSPDLVHWGQHHRLTTSEKGEISGTGAPPVKTGNLWIEAYHETTRLGKGVKYETRLLSLDADDPWKVLGKSPVLLERDDFREILPQDGFVPNVVFTTGMILDHDRTDMYHGIDDEWAARTVYHTEDILKFAKCTR